MQTMAVPHNSKIQGLAAAREWASKGVDRILKIAILKDPGDPGNAEIYRALVAYKSSAARELYLFDPMLKVACTKDSYRSASGMQILEMFDYEIIAPKKEFGKFKD